MRTPEDEIRFVHERRKWIARQWPSSDGTFFWKFAPEDQSSMPTYSEYLRAVAHFERPDAA